MQILRRLKSKKKKQTNADIGGGTASYIFVMILIIIALIAVIKMADYFKQEKSYPVETTEAETATPSEAEVIYIETEAEVATPSNYVIYESLGTFKVTAYCPCRICCGKWAGGKTASGTYPKAGRTVAVDRNVIAMGSVLYIDGVEYIAEDTGSAIKGNRIDIFFNDHQEALNFGVQHKEVYLKIDYKKRMCYN